MPVRARRRHHCPEEESFDLLSDDFSGFTIQGVPIDLDILRQAGIEGCDAIAAVTEDDNTNIMVCQIAREIFNVPRIVARIFDPLREDIFSRFDIQSVCPTNITVSSVYAMLTDAPRPDTSPSATKLCRCPPWSRRTSWWD